MKSTFMKHQRILSTNNNSHKSDFIVIRVFQHANKEMLRNSQNFRTIAEYDHVFYCAFDGRDNFKQTHREKYQH